VRRLLEEGFNDGNLALVDEIVAPGMVEHQSFGPGHAPGPDGVKAVIASLRRAFSTSSSRSRTSPSPATPSGCA
jgi:hypothetical protein